MLGKFFDSTGAGNIHSDKWKLITKTLSKKSKTISKMPYVDNRGHDIPSIIYIVQKRNTKMFTTLFDLIFFSDLKSKYSDLTSLLDLITWIYNMFRFYNTNRQIDDGCIPNQIYVALAVCL